MEIYFKYGPNSDDYEQQTNIFSLTKDEPYEMILDNLETDTRHFYSMYYRLPEQESFTISEEKIFHTQKQPNRSFTFAVHADPHLDEQSDTEVYNRCLSNTLADNPDFLIDLGDNFMSDKLVEQNVQEVVNRHLLLRSFYNNICHSIPLFLVIGNHEGELGWLLDGTPDNLAMWATKARQLYYPNPFPNHFYSGSTKEEEFIGLRENYYAWEWGDALFVVLDPYWYTITKPGKSNDNWNWTLGYDQYSWFKQTLEESNATFKFVFCHQLVGGKDTEGRGGSEYANYYEMGGLNEDNSWGFNEKRSVWGKPIHQLMVDYHVNIFFHGHDHFFAKQNVDGVIYQLVPQPSHPNYKKTGQAEPYGYVNGVILSNSGHLRVTVEETDVTVDYIRAYLPENETDGRKNGEIGYSYTINATDSVETSLKNSNVQPSLLNWIKISQIPSTPAQTLPSHCNRKAMYRSK